MSDPSSKLKRLPHKVDMVNHPPHYQHPSGVECIAITEHMTFCIGNVVKYLWRCEGKHESPLEDLRKARWYLDREIKRREAFEKVSTNNT